MQFCANRRALDRYRSSRPFPNPNPNPSPSPSQSPSPSPSQSQSPTRTRARTRTRYEIEPAFRALFADESLLHYRVAMAYLGPRWLGLGLELGLGLGLGLGVGLGLGLTLTRVSSTGNPNPNQATVTLTLTRGVELVELALRRGAHVELLLPARANVYAHANLLAAQVRAQVGDRLTPTLS